MCVSGANLDQEPTLEFADEEEEDAPACKKLNQKHQTTVKAQPCIRAILDPELERLWDPVDDYLEGERGQLKEMLDAAFEQLRMAK